MRISCTDFTFSSKSSGLKASSSLKINVSPGLSSLLMNLSGTKVIYFNSYSSSSTLALTYIGSVNEGTAIGQDATKLYRIEDTNSNVVRYEHSSLGGDDSGFRRWLEIESLPYEGVDSVPGELKIAVTAVVEWEERGRVSRVSIPTVFTDWKSGPL